MNQDQKTIDGFGDEWQRFDQSDLDTAERQSIFEQYFYIFPWKSLPKDAIGFDMGCGSGRWAQLVAPRVGKLHCIDPSAALEVARRNLGSHENCIFHRAAVGDSVLQDGSMDFGYSLGVLHHVPDTEAGIRACVQMLKSGAPFLLYLYYAMENRPVWYRALWRASNLLRVVVSKLPHGLRYYVCQLIAVVVYWPLARAAAIVEYLGVSGQVAAAMPLGFYRHRSFYTMRTDALDRFGTRLEKRFTRKEIESMMKASGLCKVEFSADFPYWCAVGYRI
jgi:2-polyprenyl-3-methyl-5-hydroxy-6-metoxy-1,4-benzoquinol methylase